MSILLTTPLFYFRTSPVAQIPTFGITPVLALSLNVEQSYKKQKQTNKISWGSLTPK